MNTNFTEICRKHDANCLRLQKLADSCEKENRELSADEKAETEKIRRENDILKMKMQAAQAINAAPDFDADARLRELMKEQRVATFALQRSVQTTAALANTGIIPVNEQDMLKPLRAGLIYDKVGVNVQFGLTGGQLRWPAHSKATASWNDEAAQLTDSNIDFSALTLTPARLGIAVPVTREELDFSQGIVERVIREEMPAAVIDAINAALFTTDTTAVVKGPFAQADSVTKTFASTSKPTRKELLEMKSAVAASGVKMIAPCWVMTEAMKAILEDEKVDAGSGRFICENDTIFGYPVFTTPAIGEGNIGFGDWSYQAAGFFGGLNLVVDPYTLARKNAVDFVLNAQFGTATLYKEAFILGKVKNA